MKSPGHCQATGKSPLGATPRITHHSSPATPCPLSQPLELRIPRQQPLALTHSLVVLSRDVEPAQEDVGIAQVAVGSALGRLVPKLLGNGQALQQAHRHGSVSTGTPHWAPLGAALRAAIRR